MMRFEIESLIQLSLFTFLGYLLVVNNYIPAGFYPSLTTWLLLLSVVGGGWPFSIPYGRPFKRLWASGVVMTLKLLLLSGISYALLSAIGMQDLATIWFWVCANWAFIFDCWPMRHETPRDALIIGSGATFIGALALDQLFSIVAPRNLLSLFLQAQLATAVVFSPFFVFQSYPFHRLWRQPRIGLAILLISIAAGLGITAVSATVETHIVLVTSGLLLWSILYSWSFAYPLSRRYGQPKRGLVTLPLIVAIALAWSYTLSLFLSPPNLVLINLYVILPAFVVHNIFWLRMPFSPPLLFGMLLQQQKSLEKLFDWFSQVRD